MKRGRSIFAVLAILAALFVVQSAPAYAGGLKQSVEITGGSLSSLPDATCNSTTTAIVPADANGECTIIQNNGSNPARIGDASCGASQCVVLAPTTSIQVCITGAIYCYSASGTTITISKVEQ